MFLLGFLERKSGQFKRPQLLDPCHSRALELNELPELGLFTANIWHMR